MRRAFDGLARQRDIDFGVDVAERAPATLMLDSVRMRNDVLGNLLSNAFKFTPPGGRIRVRVDGAVDGLHIEVIDTGCGIPPERLPYIFEAYYRGSNDREDPGSGLGLAIARRIVEAHGGTITASSEPGNGTTFRVRIPAHEPLAGRGDRRAASETAPARA